MPKLKLKSALLLSLGISFVFFIFAINGCTRKRELGNVLRTSIREKYKSMDPAHGTDFYSHILISRTYEPLLKYHYLKRPYEIEPLLAEALPRVSSDGLIYTFKIRRDARFQDDKAFGAKGNGREVTAEDFIYSFKRIANPLEPSESYWALDGKIAGLTAWVEATRKSGHADFNAPVEGLKALDSKTLVIRLTRPNPLILHVLTMPSMSVVAREAVEAYGKEFLQHPVGTGPFKLETLTPNQLIWVKNPAFHSELYPSEGSVGDKEAGRLADAGKRLPFVDKVIDDIIIEDQPAWLNFMQGNHDYLGHIGKDNTAEIFDQEHHLRKSIRDRGIQGFAEPGLWFNYIAFNYDDPVVGGEKNKVLRKAMSLALDESPMIEKFYLSLARRAESIIPPGVSGYDPEYKNPARQYNLAKAREMLAKAGYPDGQGIPEISYDVKSDITYRQVAEYFQRSMAELGIKVKLNSMSWPELLGRIRKKQSQVFGITWLYDYPDAENGWQLLYSKNESPGSNEANYKNPKIDALYEKISVMKNGPERNALFKKMRDIFSEDVPWILTVHQMETRLAHRWLYNFKIHAFEHNVDKYLRVDAEERSRFLR